MDVNLERIIDFERIKNTDLFKDNAKREKQVKEIYKYILASVRDKSCVELSMHEPFRDSAFIKISAKEIIFSCPEFLSKLIEVSDCTNIDSSGEDVEIEFQFWELAEVNND